MTYRELLAVCDLVPAKAKRLAMCEPFICENEDLNDFFANDAILYSKHLLGKTYLLCLKDPPSHSCGLHAVKLNIVVSTLSKTAGLIHSAIYNRSINAKALGKQNRCCSDFRGQRYRISPRRMF